MSDQKFQQMANRLDRSDKMLKDFDKNIRNMEKRIKQREIEHSQLAHAFQQANNIVKHLVLQNWLLQKRTGGVLTNDELEEGQKELQALADKRKKSLNPISLQPAGAGPVKRSGK